VPQQPAAVDHHDAAADSLEFAEQVRGDDHRDTEVRADAPDQFQHVVTAGRVQPVGGFVEKHQARVVYQALGELHALSHARGVAAHRPVPLLVQADVPEDVRRTLAGGRRRQPGHPGHVHHELGGGDIRRQAIVLGHIADALADCRAVGCHVEAEDVGTAFRGS
jgi:hypothetical protein